MSKPADALPTITSDIPRDLRTYLDRLRGLLNQTGGIVTADDLKSYRLIDASGQPVDNSNPQPSPVEYGAPAVVANLDADGAFQNIIVTWDQPDYYGHAFTEIWGSPTYDTTLSSGDPGYVDPTTYETFDSNTATLVGITAGSVFSDNVGGATGRYYWARNINLSGREGAFNSVTGVNGETAVDTTFILSALTDSITSSQLATSLATPIGNLPTDTQAEVNSLQSQINTLSTVASWASGTTYALDDLVTYNGNLYRSKVNSNVGNQPSGNTSDTTYWGFVGTYTSLSAAVAGNTSDITQINFVDATSTSAIAVATNTLNTTVAGHTTSISTQATSINGLEAQYTVKIDNAGHVSGYGLASTAVDGTPTSAFGIRADQFWVAPPATASATAPTTNLYAGRVWLDTSGGTGNYVTKYYNADTSNWDTTPTALPFVVQATPTTIGSTPIPAGVYIDAAFIRNASIQTAQIAELAVDNARIANAAITNLKVADAAITNAKISGIIQSDSNNNVGDPLWSINKNGGAQFRSLLIEDIDGNVIMQSDEIEGTYIKNGTITNAEIQNGTITDAEINDLNASKITAGTLDATDVDVINLTVSNLSGDVTEIDTFTATNVPFQVQATFTRSLVTIPEQINAHRPFVTVNATAQLQDNITVWGELQMRENNTTAKTVIGTASSSSGAVYEDYFYFDASLTFPSTVTIAVGDLIGLSTLSNPAYKVVSIYTYTGAIVAYVRTTTNGIVYTAPTTGEYSKFPQTATWVTVSKSYAVERSGPSWKPMFFQGALPDSTNNEVEVQIVFYRSGTTSNSSATPPTTTSGSKKFGILNIQGVVMQAR